jgi:hypothetical protein
MGKRMIGGFDINLISSFAIMHEFGIGYCVLVVCVQLVNLTCAICIINRIVKISTLDNLAMRAESLVRIDAGIFRQLQQKEEGFFSL